MPSGAGDVHILRDISLALPAAKTVSIVGPSGSGKTSLLMVLGGLEKPTGGRIHIADRELTGLDEDGFMREVGRAGLALSSWPPPPRRTSEAFSRET